MSLVLRLLLLAGCAWAQGDPLAQKAAQAKQLMGAERFGEAAAVYGELVTALPANTGLRMNYGMALHMAGEDAKAIPELERVIKANPATPPALLMLGGSYLRTQQPGKALGVLEKFFAYEPNHLPALQMLVDAALQQNQATRALPYLQKLAQLDPKNPAVYYELGRSCELAAQETFAQLEKKFPESGVHFALIAESRSKANQGRAAFFFYRKALEKSPELRGIRTAVAEIYRQSGEPSWAIAEEAAEAKLPKLNCAMKTAECEYAAGRYASAWQLAKVGSTPASYYWRVRSLNQMAREAFETLTSLPESPEAFRFVAETQRDQGRLAESIAAWREALRLSPGNPAFERELSATLLTAKQYEEAQKLLTGLLQKEADAPDLNHLQGDLFLAQQQAEGALPFLKNALKGNPGSAEVHASLARALLAVGKPAEAVPHVTAALPLDVDGSLHFQLARAYQAAGQAEQAAKAMAVYQQLKERTGKEQTALEQQMQIGPPK